MRYTAFIALALFAIAASASGQKQQRTQNVEADSVFIAREWAVWNAIKAGDSAAVVHAIGSDESLYFVMSSGVTHTSAATFAGASTKCDTRSHRLDLFTVLHPNDDTAIVIYRVTLARSCGAPVNRGWQQMAMTVWARRNGRWNAIVQSLVPMTGGNNSK